MAARSRRLLRIFVLGVVAWTSAPRAAEAQIQPPPARKGARLVWVRGVGADRCVGIAGLEEDVKTRLAYDPFVLPTVVTIEGAIVRAGTTGFRAELVVRDDSGKVLGARQLTSRDPDCRSLGEAVAVAITVTIDPDSAGTRPPVVEESFVPEPAMTSAPKPGLSKSSAGLGAHMMLSIGGSVGLVPSIAPVASLRARIRVGRAWEIGAGAHVWPESREPDTGVGFALTSGSIDGCAIPLDSFGALRWCAGFHAGLVHVFVHSPDLAPVEVGSFAWAGAETGPALSIPLTGVLRLEASASALLPILRREASIRGRASPIWEQEVVGGRADVGLGAAF